MTITTQEDRKALLMRKAEREIDAQLRKEAYDAEKSRKNARIDQLARELRDLGFKSTPLVLVVHSTTNLPDHGGRTETITSHTTTATQFLFSRSRSTALLNYDTLPSEGSPDPCFGLTRSGEVRVGYTDNRCPSEVYHVEAHYSYEVLADLLENHIERLKSQ